MSKLAAPNTSSPPPITFSQRIIKYRLYSRRRIVASGLLLLLCYITIPTILYATNLAYAGQELEAGLEWPLPREVDSLPSARDTEALSRAVAYLAAAERWQPNDPFVQRLTSRVHVANRNWIGAAEKIEQARSKDPRNPQIAMEAALLYEQIWQVVSKAPRENMLPILAAQPIDAPLQPIDTVYCRNDDATTCYVDLDRYTQTYAAIPNGPPLTADVLFMHPPAGVRLTRVIPYETPALSFLMGLDPNVRTWRTDGATFEIWITPDRSSPVRVFHHTLDASTAKKGWVAGHVNLARWSGQVVTLELRTSGGVAEDTTDDWYAWGNVAFTQIDAAAGATLLPFERMRQAWQSMIYATGGLRNRGDEALQAQQFGAALRWYERALHLEQTPTFDVFYRRAVAAINSGHESAETLLADARDMNETLEVADVPYGGSARITGADFRWMSQVLGGPTYGGRLGDQPGPRPDAGYLWWQGQAATIVRTASEGVFQLDIEVVHGSPPPVQLAVGIDGAQIADYELARGDGSTESLELSMHLSRGLHTINIWFINDSSPSGTDRNAVIGNIIITQEKR